MSEIRIVADAQALALDAVQEFVQQASHAIREKGRFTVALAGGSTPKTLYTLLAQEPFRAQVVWEQVYFFWGDERHVPPDDSASNYRMAHDAMLSHLPMPQAHIHRIKGETPNAAQAAAQYEHVLRGHFRLEADQIPCLDLILLGLGTDGHTASLFSGTEAIHETTHLVIAPWVETLGAYRITVTPPVLNHAAQVMFLVSGMDKAATVKHVLKGDYRPEQYPAQVVRPVQGRLLWLLDREAASALSWQT